MVKEKQSGDVFAMKTLKKSQTLAQESVSIFHYYFIKSSAITGSLSNQAGSFGNNAPLKFCVFNIVEISVGCAISCRQ